MTPSHFILVEAERYRYLARRSHDPEMSAHWSRAVAQLENIARRYDAQHGGADRNSAGLTNNEGS
jgi:hypothetical protein